MDQFSSGAHSLSACQKGEWNERASRFGTKKLPTRPQASEAMRAEASARGAREPREQSEACLSAFQRRRAERVSEPGVWGQSPQTNIGGAARN